MRAGGTWLTIVAVVLLGAAMSAHAVILKSVSVDIDGDGIAETLYYCVGDAGEPNQPYVYYPADFVGGFNMPRVHVGMYSLQEVVLHEGQRVLDSGLPIMAGDRLVIQNPLYQSRTTETVGDSIVTTWYQGDVRLVRTVWMSHELLFAVYNAFSEKTSPEQPSVTVRRRVMHAGFVVPWNQGRTPFQAATAFVDSAWVREHQRLHHLFPPGQVRNGWELRVSYGFDDWLERRAGDYLWGWDDVGCALMGMGFLPEPDSLYLTGVRQPLGQRANVIWSRHSDIAVDVADAAPGIPIMAHPNPFVSFAAVTGQEGERFAVYDISGRRVGTYRGDKIGEGLLPGVYLLRSVAGNGKAGRIVKTR